MSDVPNPDDLPTFAGTPEAAPKAESAASRVPIGKIGRYTLIRVIGEGGMGTVYEAEQDQPRRTVALKVIKPGLAGPELIRRFAQESQALGRLQHPGIAQIYDAGTADAGYGAQPYFAMEFIRGEGLRDYVEHHHLNTRQRIEIFVKVCDAVHHAHQRGLIHRDLKPVNILVDESGQPKILDFGVARVTDSDAQATMQTDVGQLVGTLAYMSPEQVLADPLELDIRSDVYALGVILYELLAGRLPYEISRKIHEALHAIREEEPTKLGTVNRMFRGDVETIAAKALEKDKTRRYASAAELAADLTRHLRDEPIVAQPPSTRYQLQKFARRHKALVGGVAAVFVVLVAGVVVSSWQAIRASRAEAAAVRDRDRATAAERASVAARDEALTAKGVAVTAEGQAKAERDKAVAEKLRADTESATAKAVTDFLQKNLFEQVTGGGQRGGAPDLSVSGALDRATAKVEGAFSKQPLVEAGVREAVAKAYMGLSLFDKAEPQVARALALRRRIQDEADVDVLKSAAVLSTIYAGQKRYAESETMLARTVDLWRGKFGHEDRDGLKYALSLAATYLADEKLDKAESTAVEVVESSRRGLGPGDKDTITAILILGAIYEKRQKIPQALAVVTPGYDSARRALGENDPLTLNLRFIKQGLDLKARNGPVDRAARAEMLAGAVKTIERTTASSLPEMIKLAASRATIAVNQGKPQEAEAPLVEAIEAARRAGQEELSLIAILSGVYALQKKWTEAETTIQKVMEKPDATLTNLGPNIVPFALRSLGTGYRNSGKFAEAEPYLRRLVSVVLVVPGESAGQTRIDVFLHGDTLSSLRKYAEAEKVFVQLLDVQRRVQSPEAVGTVVTVSNIGWVRLQQGRVAEAEQTFREAASILVRAAPDSWERFNNDSMLGAALAVQRKFAEAEPLLVSGYEGMVLRKPGVNVTVVSRFTREQAGAAIVQCYADWGKQARRDEWAERVNKK